VDELLITADVRTRDQPSVDEFISRVEGTKVYGMDDVLSHHAERRQQPGMTSAQLSLRRDLFTQPPMRPMRICFTYIFLFFFLFCFFRFFPFATKIPDNRSRERLNGFS